MTNRGSFGLGFSEEYYQWFETENTAIRQELSDTGTRLLEIWFELSETMIQHKRSVYTFYDFLGDLGGLYGMLEIVC